MKRVINIIAGISLLMGIISGILAWEEEKPYRQEQVEQKMLQKTVVLQGEKNSPLERSIDFRALNKINADIEGWIYIPGTNIDYPVLIGKTDSEYLNKNFKGEENLLGAIFGFSDMSRDFTDGHICLFGHNTCSAQMFGELKKYKEKIFAENHQKLYVYTSKGVKEYRLFSVYECGKRDETFQHKMQKGSMEFMGLFQRMLEKNVVKMDRSLSAGDKQIMTLSCCSEHQRTENRMTVHFMETDSICAIDIEK